MLRILYIFLIFSTLNLHARTLVISDIDDTIRQTNVLSKVRAVRSILMQTASFQALGDIYNYLQFHYLKSPIGFYYLSAAPECFVEHDDWVEKQKLPVGIVYQRPCNYTWLISDFTFRYKFRTISKIIKRDISQYGVISKILLFGDNAEHDPEVYKKIKEEFSSIDIQIFIRDIRVEATAIDSQLVTKRIDGVNYFLTENDLLHDPNFTILPEGKKIKIRDDFKLGKLYPKYLYRNLARRYEAELGMDEEQAKVRAYSSLVNILRY